jgi:ribosomal protein S27AE
MTGTIVAPWTDEQVAALNRFQTCGFVHEFTCGNDHAGGRVLVAHRDGWQCPSCNYTQNWAHRLMLEKPVDPFARFRFDPTAGLGNQERQD